MELGFAFLFYLSWCDVHSQCMLRNIDLESYFILNTYKIKRIEMYNFHELLNPESLEQIIKYNDIITYASRAYLEDELDLCEYNSESLNIEFIGYYLASYLNLPDTSRERFVDEAKSIFCDNIYPLMAECKIPYLRDSTFKNVIDLRFDSHTHSANSCEDLCSDSEEPISLEHELCFDQKIFEFYPVKDLPVNREYLFIKKDHPFVCKDGGFLLDNRGRTPGYQSMMNNGTCSIYKYGDQHEFNLDFFDEYYLYRGSTSDGGRVCVHTSPRKSLIYFIAIFIAQVFVDRKNVDSYIAQYKKTVDTLRTLVEYIVNMDYRRTVNNVLFLCHKGLLLDSAIVLQRLTNLHISSLDELLDTKSYRGQKLEETSKLRPGLYISMTSNDYANFYEQIFCSHDGIKKSLTLWKKTNCCLSTTRRNFPNSQTKETVRRVHILLDEFTKLFFVNDILRDQFILNGIDTYNKKFKNKSLYDFGRDYYKYYLENKSYIDENFNAIKSVTALNVQKFGSLYVVTCEGGVKYCISRSILQGTYIEYGQRFIESYRGEGNSWQLRLSDYNQIKEKYFSNFKHSYIDCEGNAHEGYLQFIRPLNYNSKKDSRQSFICHDKGLVPEAHDHYAFIEKVSQANTELLDLLAKVDASKFAITQLSNLFPEEKTSKASYTTDQGMSRSIADEIRENSFACPEMFETYSSLFEKHVANVKSVFTARVNELRANVNKLAEEYSYKRKALDKLLLSYTSLSPMNTYDVKRLVEIGVITPSCLKKSKRLISTERLFSINNVVMTREAYYYACSLLLDLVDQDPYKDLDESNSIKIDGVSYTNRFFDGEYAEAFPTKLYDMKNNKIVFYSDLLAAHKRKELVKESFIGEERVTKEELERINGVIHHLSFDDLQAIDESKGCSDEEFIRKNNCTSNYYIAMTNVCSRVFPKEYSTVNFFDNKVSCKINCDSYDLINSENAVEFIEDTLSIESDTLKNTYYDSGHLDYIVQTQSEYSAA